MYDELYDSLDKTYVYPFMTDIDEVKQILKRYLDIYYNELDAQEIWFNKIKNLSEEFWLCQRSKEYKNNKEKYKGHVGDVSTILRVALTSRDKTIDLYAIMSLLGKKRIEKRFEKIINE